MKLSEALSTGLAFRSSESSGWEGPYISTFLFEQFSVRDVLFEEWQVRLPDGTVTDSYEKSVDVQLTDQMLADGLIHIRGEETVVGAINRVMAMPEAPPLKLSEALKRYPLVLTRGTVLEISWIKSEDGTIYAVDDGFVSSIGSSPIEHYDEHWKVIDYLDPADAVSGEESLTFPNGGAIKYHTPEQNVPDAYRSSFHNEPELKVSANQLHNELTLIKSPANQTCTCESLLNGHVNGCGYKAGEE